MGKLINKKNKKNKIKIHEAKLQQKYFQKEAAVAPIEYIIEGGGFAFSAANNLIWAMQDFKPEGMLGKSDKFSMEEWKRGCDRLGKKLDRDGNETVIWPRLERYQPLNNRHPFSEQDGAFLHVSAVKQLMSERRISLKTVMHSEAKRRFNVQTNVDWIVQQQSGHFLILISSKQYGSHFTVVDAFKGNILDSFLNKAILLSTDSLKNFICNQLTDGDGMISGIYKAQWNHT